MIRILWMSVRLGIWINCDSTNKLIDEVESKHYT
jgi:hypothetical protein